jgi:hypothetical protein
MNTDKRNQNQKQESHKSKSEQPIPFTRRGLNEDEQKKVTNTDGNKETENSSDYTSTARQDEKAKPTREGHKKNNNFK